MNITKTIKKLVTAIAAYADEDNRENIYEAMLESFDEDELAELEVDEVMGICPYFDDQLVRACPDLFDTGDCEDEDEDGYIDSMDDEWTDGDDE